MSLHSNAANRNSNMPIAEMLKYEEASVFEMINQVMLPINQGSITGSRRLHSIIFLLEIKISTA